MCGLWGKCWVRDEGLSENDDISSDKYSYTCFGGDSMKKMVKVGRMIYKRIKLRKKIIEDPG